MVRLTRAYLFVRRTDYLRLSAGKSDACADDALVLVFLKIRVLCTPEAARRESRNFLLLYSRSMVINKDVQLLN